MKRRNSVKEKEDICVEVTASEVAVSPIVNDETNVQKMVTRTLVCEITMFVLHSMR